MARHIAPLAKQPAEDVKYDFDFEPVMRAGATLTATGASIAQSRAAAADFDGADTVWLASTDLTLGTPTVGAKSGAALNTLFQVQVAGGTDGYFYKLEAVCDDTDGNTYEVDGVLEVLD